jgi:DNA-binding LytR/AlgR family response regulator
VINLGAGFYTFVRVDNISFNVNASNTMETLLLPDFTNRRSVPVASIEYLEAMGNYTTVHMIGQKPMLVAITLKRFAERLPNFLRIHKRTLVNPAHIVAYRTRFVETPFVQLSQDRTLAISRRQTKRLRPQLTSFPLCTVHS